MRHQIYIQVMSQGLSTARAFLIGGGTLALIGILLWLTLPIPMGFPPYLPTALLALVYGAIDLMRNRSRGPQKS